MSNLRNDRVAMSNLLGLVQTNVKGPKPRVFEKAAGERRGVGVHMQIAPKSMTSFLDDPEILDRPGR